MRDRAIRKRWAIVAVSGIAAGGIAFAELQTNQSLLAEVRAGMKSVSPIIATLNKGDKVDVLNKEKKGWLKVKVGEKTGYVPESALKKEEGQVGLASADPRASRTELAAAGKGLTDRTLAYASTKQFSTAGLEKMLEVRRGIDANELNSFAAEGNLAPIADAAGAAPAKDVLAMAAGSRAKTEEGGEQ